MKSVLGGWEICQVSHKLSSFWVPESRPKCRSKTGNGLMKAPWSSFPGKWHSEGQNFLDSPFSHVLGILRPWSKETILKIPNSLSFSYSNLLRFSHSFTWPLSLIPFCPCHLGPLGMGSFARLASDKSHLSLVQSLLGGVVLPSDGCLQNLPIQLSSFLSTESWARRSSRPRLPPHTTSTLCTISHVGEEGPTSLVQPTPHTQFKMLWMRW